MESKLFLPVILGTSRQDRLSEPVANYVHTFVQTFPIETQLIDVRTFPQTQTKDPNADMSAWRELAKRADGLIIVSPEYNHGYPGELKLFLDVLDEDELDKKPVGIIGVSSGPWGGVRMIEQLRLVAIAFAMVPIHAALQFGMAKTLFDEQGQLKDKTKWDERLGEFTKELMWFAQALKNAK